MKSAHHVKPSHELYLKYEYLANIYANKLFNSNAIGMDREDVVQELKMKIYTSIKTFGKKWGEYERTGNCKPVPLPYYLKAALNNKIDDMVDEIRKDINKQTISIETNGFDYGYETHDNTDIDFEKKSIVVNGVDFLQGLRGKEVDAFSLFLKGHPIKQVEKLFKHKINNIGEVITSQVNKIKEFKSELLLPKEKLKYSFDMSEEY